MSDSAHTNGLHVSKVRVGGPDLYRLPAARPQALPYDNASRRAWDSDLRGEVLAILDKQVLVHESMLELSLYLCGWLYSPLDQHRETIWILMEQPADDVESWLLACTEIQTLCVERGLGHLSVEMIARVATRPSFSLLVSPSDPLFAHWDDVRDAVVEQLGGTDWRLVEALRRGIVVDEGSHPDDLPSTVTVVITVDLQSSVDWDEVRVRVRAVLRRFQLDGVEVEIMRGPVSRACGRDYRRMLEDVRSNLIRPGSSLGQAVGRDSAASFGPYLELDMGRGRRVRLALTNYHCVAPADANEVAEPLRACLEGWHRAGICAEDGDAQRQLRLNSPAPMDIEEFIGVSRESIQSFRDERFEEIEEKLREPGASISTGDKIEFLEIRDIIQAKKEQIEAVAGDCEPDRIHAGHVWAASGRRAERLEVIGRDSRVRVEERRLDWALVQVPDRRVGSNEVGWLE